MNEITRIHIAKIPYDIEISAKKEIERYIKSLEAYAKDAELLRDIEIRITELLLPRGIAANGVISEDDVSAIREQLGEPKDFMSGDEDIVEERDDTVTTRRLYRNVDSAILGGVLSGIASYFRINPLWTRLAFVVLFIFSAGTVCLAYIMLWIIVPPAKTATEKLQMSGRSVTLASIRELNEDEPSLASGYERANYVRHFISIIFGTLCLLLSAVTVVFTTFAAINIFGINIFSGGQEDASWMYICAYILAILAGLLLATLFAVCSYVAFSHKHSRKLLISVVSIVVLGLASFGTAVGLMAYQSYSANSIIQQDTQERSIDLPLSFNNTKTLIVNANFMDINYVVSDNYKIIFKSLSDAKRPTVLINGSDLTISLPSSTSKWARFRPTLTIYGPKLSKIITKAGGVTYSSGAQDLSIEAIGQSSTISLNSGTYKNLSILASDQSSVDTAIVTVENATISSELGSQITMGTVKTLSIVQPEACPSNVNASVHVQNVSSGIMAYNGNNVSAKTYNNDCGSVIVGEVNY